MKKRMLGLFIMLVLFSSFALPIAGAEGITSLYIGVVYEYEAMNVVLENAFLLQNPDARIVYYLYSEQALMKVLETGEPRLDLVIVDSALRQQLIEKGLLADLYDEVLTAWPDTLLDIREVCETDGKLYGFPRSIYQPTWGWNNKLAEKYGIEKPRFGWTWSEFADLCESLDFDPDGDGKNDFYLAHGSKTMVEGMNNIESDMIQEYCQQYPENLDTPLFYEQLSNFERVQNSKALLAIDTIDPPTFEGNAAVLIAFYGSISPLNFSISGDDVSLITVPLLEEENMQYAGGITYYAMPARNASIAAVSSFLELASNPLILNFCDLMTPELAVGKNVPQNFVVNWDNWPSFQLNYGNKIYTVSQPWKTAVSNAPYTPELAEQTQLIRSSFVDYYAQPGSFANSTFQTLAKYMRQEISAEEVAALLQADLRPQTEGFYPALATPSLLNPLDQQPMDSIFPESLSLPSEEQQPIGLYPALPTPVPPMN